MQPAAGTMLLAPSVQVPALLILEGNADRLRREGHAKIADEIERVFAKQVEAGTLRITRVALRTAADVDWWTKVAGLVKYTAVVILAHGSPQGVEAAAGLDLRWDDVAARLARTNARHILAVSCFGASSPATDQLFTNMPTLDRIVGSPAPITIRQAAPALLDLALAVFGVPLGEEWALGLNMLTAALTNGVLFVRTRAGRDASTSGDRLVEDLGGLLLWAFLRYATSNDLSVRPVRSA